MLPTDKDKLPIQLIPPKLREYLKKLDERGESYHFNVSNPVGNPVVILLLQDENGQTPLKVQLHPDGRWVAEYEIDI